MKIEEFSQLVDRQVTRHSEFAKIRPEWIVAYGTQHSRPAGENRLYLLSGEREPESYTSAARYFVQMSLVDWKSMSDCEKEELIREVLVRIDRAAPEQGRVLAGP